LKKQNIEHPRIVIIIEACEESGSPDLPFYITKLANENRFGDIKLIICLDSGCGNYEQFWITTSLRGVTTGTLKVKILEEGAHSGSASGIVPSSFRIIRMLLDRIEDSQTGKVLVPELYTEITPEIKKSAEKTSHYLGHLIYSEFRFAKNAKPTDTNLAELLLNRNWRPQLSITGVDGMPTIQSGGNVLRVETLLKLSMRVPPRVDPGKGSLAMKEILERDPPYGALVSYSVMSFAKGWSAPIREKWLDDAVEEASQLYFKKPFAEIGEGGTIPFMSMLGEMFPKAQFVITGILGPGSNAHGPNEFIHIPAVKKLTCSIVHIINAFNQKI